MDSRPRRFATLACVAVIGLCFSAPAAANPACRSTPCHDQAQAVVLSYYQGSDLPRLVRAIRRANLPQTTPIYYGNYWGSGKPSEPKPPKGRKKPKVPGRLAPIFPLIEKSIFWRARKIPASQRPQLPNSVRWKHRGRIPSKKRLMKMSNGARYAWGKELGRRFRDRIRSKRKRGTHVVTWQLDEIPHEVSGPHGARLRVFIRGVLNGVYGGRKQLGDKPLPGIVWITQPALKIAGKRARGDLAVFWKQLDKSTEYLVGEEYPAFTGPAAARREEAGARPAAALARGRRAALAGAQVHRRDDARLPAREGTRRQRQAPLTASGAAVAADLRARALEEGRVRLRAVQLPLQERGAGSDERRLAGAIARGAAAALGRGAGARAPAGRTRNKEQRTRSKGAFALCSLFSVLCSYAWTLLRMKSTMSAVGEPGVKTSATPSFFSSGTSSAGIVPPTVTSTSSAPCAFSSSTTFGTSVM